MGKNKERWYPDKKQNHYGKECFWYEKDDTGHGWCSAPYIDLINPLTLFSSSRFFKGKLVPRKETYTLQY